MTAGMETEKPIQAARLLENRVAIVTGASRGIGAAIALLFAEHGAAIGINYHSNQAALATELGPHGIRVNAIAPGVTLTDALSSQPQEWKDSVAGQTPLRRNRQPEDIASAVLKKASEPARFITGTYLMVNGGSQKQ